MLEYMKRQSTRSTAARCLQGLAVGVLVLAAGTVGGSEAANQRALLDEARKVSDTLLQQVRGELVKALETSGPLRAIVACKYTVPEIASNVSRKTGWRVSRVSLKPRNQAVGMPDAWEQKVLLEFDNRIARGEKPETLEFGEMVSEPIGRSYRYMKALPMLPMCMNCHGSTDAMSDAVKAQLGTEYPFDRAVGYRVGQVRGAVTAQKLLD